MSTIFTKNILLDWFNYGNLSVLMQVSVYCRYNTFSVTWSAFCGLCAFHKLLSHVSGISGPVARISYMGNKAGCINNPYRTLTCIILLTSCEALNMLPYLTYDTPDTMAEWHYWCLTFKFQMFALQNVIDFSRNAFVFFCEYNKMNH